MQHFFACISTFYGSLKNNGHKIQKNRYDVIIWRHIIEISPNSFRQVLQFLVISAIIWDRHFFENEDHDFEKHAKITLIEKVENTAHMTQPEITTILEQREDFWMLKLNTLIPDGFNQERNFPS